MSDLNEPVMQGVIETGLTVDILSDCAQVHLDHGMRKTISIQDLIASLENSLGNDRSGAVEGLVLPRNVVYYGQTLSKVYLNVYYPEETKPVAFDRERPEPEILPRVLPNILISAEFEKRDADWNLLRARYFCTDLPANRLPRRFINAIAPRDRIFLFPFTNTYSDGSMCYGRNTMPVRFAEGSLRGFDWYYQYLFESPFNSDLGLYGVSGKSVNEWFALLAERAANGQTFPYSDLVGFTTL